jgi:hypothetical protein
LQFGVKKRAKRFELVDLPPKGTIWKAPPQPQSRFNAASRKMVTRSGVEAWNGGLTEKKECVHAQKLDALADAVVCACAAGAMAPSKSRRPINCRFILTPFLEVLNIFLYILTLHITNMLKKNQYQIYFL